MVEGRGLPGCPSVTRSPLLLLTASEEESSLGRPAQLLPSTKTFAFQMQIRRCGVFVEVGG